MIDFAMEAADYDQQQSEKSAALIDQLCELTKRWNTHEDVPRSQQLECKKIGRGLHAIGKEALMRTAYYEAKKHNPAASVIAAYWDGIGDWQW